VAAEIDVARRFSQHLESDSRAIGNLLSIQEKTIPL
jgi:hypothetical protein